MSSARRRLALVALVLLTLGGSTAVAVGGTHVTLDGHLAATARIGSPDGLATGVVVGTTPKAARGSGTTSSKRQARSTTLAALAGTLGALALLRRRLGHGAAAASHLALQRSRLSRAPPGLATTSS